MLLSVALYASATRASCPELVSSILPKLHSDLVLSRGFSPICKSWPGDDSKMIVVVAYTSSHAEGSPAGAAADDDADDVATLLVDPKTGDILSRRIDKDPWSYDEPRFVGAGIDTAPYWLAPGVRAFGLSVPWTSYHHASGMASTILTLYVVRGRNIEPVAAIETDADSGGFESDCEWTHGNTKRLIVIGKSRSNGFADLIV